MAPSTSVHSDEAIQIAVHDELNRTPGIDPACIGVAVDDGAVSLYGQVQSYAEKLAVKHAALRVHGVSAVVDEIVMHPRTASTLTETDIAREVQHALTQSSTVPDTVKAEVRHHIVTLTGQVQWNFQREAAVLCVQCLRGVDSVIDLLTLTARPSASDIKQQVADALSMDGLAGEHAVDVSVSGNTVILTGSVHSWPQREKAAQAALASPLVTDVDNRIRVRA